MAMPHYPVNIRGYSPEQGLDPLFDLMFGRRPIISGNRVILQEHDTNGISLGSLIHVVDEIEDRTDARTNSDGITVFNRLSELSTDSTLSKKHEDNSEGKKLNDAVKSVLAEKLGANASGVLCAHFYIEPRKEQVITYPWLLVSEFGITGFGTNGQRGSAWLMPDLHTPRKSQR